MKFTPTGNQVCLVSSFSLVVYHNAAIFNTFVAFTWDVIIVDEESGVCSLEYFPTPCDNLTSSLENECIHNFCVGHLSLDVDITLIIQLLDIWWHW